MWRLKETLYGLFFHLLDYSILTLLFPIGSLWESHALGIFEKTLLRLQHLIWVFWISPRTVLNSHLSQWATDSWAPGNLSPVSILMITWKLWVRNALCCGWEDPLRKLHAYFLLTPFLGIWGGLHRLKYNPLLELIFYCVIQVILFFFAFLFVVILIGFNLNKRCLTAWNSHWFQRQFHMNRALVSDLEERNLRSLVNPFSGFPESLLYNNWSAYKISSWVY